MGSVPPDYICPWCGRQNGGYLLDAIPECDPICANSDDSCLDLAIKSPYVQSKAEYLEYVADPERFSQWKLRESALLWILIVREGSGSIWDRILADVSRFL